MRAGLLALCVLLVLSATMASSSRARERVGVTTAFPASYQPPAGDRLGERIKHRAWTYDIALAATAGALEGDLDGAGALLDALQARLRPDGALEASYTLSGDDGAGPLRSGNQAWVGLAALQWRMLTCSGRHDRLLAGVARWLLAQRIDDPRAPGFGLLRGGPDVSWASTEHNLEARAFFAGLADTFDGRHCPPGLDDAPSELSAQAHEAVVRLDAAIETALFAHDGDGRAYLRQGLGDDARPLDVQALGMLWLIGRGRHGDARDVERTTDATMLVSGRRVGASAQTFTGYRPFADTWGPDVLWMEGTLMMRLAKTRLGSDTAVLDDSVARWAALTAPAPPLKVDRAAGEDYQPWPAAAPAAWLALSHSEFALLQ